MLTNGGFESGSFSPGWKRTTPNGACYSNSGTVNSVYPHTGSYSLADGCVDTADQIGYSFMVTAGQIYNVSFYIKMGGSGGISWASVTLS